MVTENTVSSILIIGTASNDSIINFGDDVTIDSRSGNDTIYSGLDDRKADRVSINAGEGDNIVSIQGGSDSVTIRTGDGNNEIGSTSPNNAVFSGAGNDSVVFYTGADNNTLFSGDGDDVIQAVGHNVTIDAGGGNDKIRTFRNAYDITIKGGAGDDDITLGGSVDTDHTNVVQYADGDGNDTISIFTATDTLQITSGNISGAELVDNDVVITVGSGKITLVEANDMNINILDADGILHQTIFSGGSSEDTIVNDTLIAGTERADYLINDKGKNVTINTFGGNDTIDNTGDNSIIDAGTGDDIVSVAGGSFVTVRTGEGNNRVYTDSNGAGELVYFGNGKNTIVTSNRNSTIIGGTGGNSITLHNGSFGSSVRSGSGNDTVAVGHHDITVDGGAGDDLINLYRDAENALIIMGAGNDTVTVYNNTHNQTFQYSGGNDIISGIKANDTLRIVGSAPSSTMVSDGNLIFDFDDDGSLTLAGISSAESLNVEYLGKWSTIDGGGWEYYSVVQRDLLGNKRPDKAAQFSLSGGNLQDTDGDGAPDNVSIGSVIYIQQSGVHTNVNHLSGNVIYNGDALGIEGDDDYNIEAISPIDTSESFPYNVYITDPNVTAIRGVSNNATISPRGTAGTSTAADWISIDSTDSKVTFRDGSYCVYTENKFSTRDYTKLTIANSNSGVEVSTADDLIQTIGNLADGYEITIESGINVGEKINFETSGNGVIVVKTTANTGKYSLAADSDEWQYQRYTINGGDDFTFVFGENGSVVGMEDFDGMLRSNETSLVKGEWVTLSSGKFQYTGNALNNPSKYASFTVSGESITSTDNLSVRRIVYMPAQNACRIELNGISGNATVDDVDLGISGDSLYSAHFTKTDDQSLINIVLMNVSDGATVESNYTAGVDDDGLITFSDGKHSVITSANPQSKVTSLEASNGGDGFELNVSDGIFGTIGGLNDGYAMTINSGDNIGDELTFQTDGGNGSIAIANKTLSAGGERDFTVEFDDDGKIIFGSWSTIDGGFVYSGHASNNYAKTADVSLIGSELKDTNGDGAPDNINVEGFSFTSAVGVMAFMTGFSGEVTLNDKDVGVIGDDDYEVHFTAKLVNNPSEGAQKYAGTKEVRGISTGATVNPNEDDIVGFDSNAKVHMGDVDNFYLYNKNHKSGGSPHAKIGIDSSGAGADLTVEDDILTKIDGLNDGYSVSIAHSDNVSDELAFKTDGGTGTIISGDKTLKVDGNKTFIVTFDSDGNIESLKNVKGSSVLITNAGEEDTTMLGGDGDDLLEAGTAINTTMTGDKGNDTFRGGANLETALITDYTEDEDVIYHGRSFSEFSLNGYIEGKDYVFEANGRTVTVQNGADKVIKGIDVNGDTRLFGKYLTLDDNDPATVTAEDNVATIDAVLRTEDIVIHGNSDDNTIISSSGDCTLYGGEGNDTFVRGSRTAEQTITIADYTEGEDVIYHGRPFAEFSLLDGTKSVGNDYISEAGLATFKYLGGTDKKIKFVDVNGDVAYFGNYATIMDVDSDTVEATEKVKVLDATKRTKAIEIVGNTLDNTIISGKGNATLTGGDGSDLFVYSAGNDVITDYTTDDKISLGAAITSTSLNGSDVVFKIADGSLTVKDAKDQTLNLIDSSGVGNATVISVDTTQVFTDLVSDVTTQASKVDSISAETTTTLGSGEAAIIAKTRAPVNITASAGHDTIISQGENVYVSLTGGNTRIFPLEGKMTLEGYDAATGAGLGTTYENIFTAVEDGSIDFNNGHLKLDSAQVYMDKRSALMNFYSVAGRQQKVGYASKNDSLDASNETKNLILVAKENGSLTGGSGDDTIFANEDSFVDGGAGKNLVKSDGATVALNGLTTVQGEVDKIYIAGEAPGVDFKAEGLSFYDNNARKYLTFSGVHSTKKLNLYYAANANYVTEVFIADDEWYDVSDGAADYYVGATAKKNHGIDFSGVSEALDVTLNTDYAADTTFWVNNIHSIRGSAGNTTITGSDKNDTILAGTGEQSISGGAGQDKMFGNTSADKNVATFYYTAGDGRDSIENFDFMNDAQDITADKVQLDDNSNISEVFLRGSDVMIKVDGADGFLMLEDAKGKSFRLNNDLIAKVDTNVEFDSFSNCYVGIGERATLTVGKDAGNVEVWLSDDSLEYHGTIYDGNFAVLDASQSDGSNILAGNELSNVITGGSGANSLWGGYGSESDTLIGGTGQNTFFYGAGNGNDKIQNAHDGDIISLEDIMLDQISEANITAGVVVLNFNDGGSLTVDGTADVTYQLADGSKYSANHSTHDWDSK